ncbi:hypothetical protein MVEG_06892 [Podila verticillata NRRL 6337]|nr:hypothetical protein MVEG_06892 [Podila verticillata NRRL 6337]
MQLPWSDMVSDDAYMSLHQMPSGSFPLSPNPSVSLPLSPFDSSFSNHECYSIFIYKISPVFHDYCPYHRDLEPPSLGPDSTTPGSFVPSDAIRRDSVMTTVSQDAIYLADGLKNGLEQFRGQVVSDQQEDGIDMDFVESNDVDETLKEFSYYSIGSGVVTSSARALRTRAAARAAPSKSAVSAKTTSSKTFRSRMTNIREASPTARKSKRNIKSSSPATTLNGSPSLRKHASTAKDEEEESADTKRTNFLERNRVAAFKCREKKRRHILKTIADANATTARNQALHEIFDELQEEVRTLKNQILSHRDCGCHMIHKFVQSNFGTDSSMCETQAPRYMSISPIHSNLRKV